MAGWCSQVFPEKRKSQVMPEKAESPGVICFHQKTAADAPEFRAHDRGFVYPLYGFLYFRIESYILYGSLCFRMNPSQAVSISRSRRPSVSRVAAGLVHVVEMILKHPSAGRIAGMNKAVRAAVDPHMVDVPRAVCPEDQIAGLNVFL